MIVCLFPGWVIKDIAPSVLCSIGSFGLGEASYCVKRTVSHPYGGFMWGGTDALVNSQHQPASHESVPSWKQLSQPQSSLQMIAAVGDILP